MKVLRKLEGVLFETMEESDEIGSFIGTDVRKEWEEDVRDRGEDPRQHDWLQSLASRKWRLVTVNLSEIKMNQRIMNYIDPRTGYSFARRLEERRRELRRELEKGKAIWPVILRGEDFQLMDGYCRFHALQEMRLGKTYAYIGIRRS